MTGYVSDGTAWRPFVQGAFSVYTPAKQTVQNAWVSDGTTWRQFYWNLLDAPTGFACTNVGQTPVDLTFAWNATPRATGYNIYWRGNQGGAWNYWGSTSALTQAIPCQADYPHEFCITATLSGVPESAISNTQRVYTGHYEQSIAAGSGYVSGNVVSHSKWRQGQWGYGGAQPYWGYYSDPANRYHGFFELPNWRIREVIAASYPQINGYWWNIIADWAGFFVSRLSGVGNWGSQYTAQMSLGDGISYGNANEPAQQGNVFDIGMAPVSSGRVGYSIPANWMQAIYQDHSAYNGFLFRPYRNDGGRQEYMGTNTDGGWDLGFHWDKIVTVAQQNSYWW